MKKIFIAISISALLPVFNTQSEDQKSTIKNEEIIVIDLISQKESKLKIKELETIFKQIKQKIKDATRKNGIEEHNYILIDPDGEVEELKEEISKIKDSITLKNYLNKMRKQSEHKLFKDPNSKLSKILEKAISARLKELEDVK